MSCIDTNSAKPEYLSVDWNPLVAMQTLISRSDAWDPLVAMQLLIKMPVTPVVAGQILISLASLETVSPQAIAWLNTNTDAKASAVAE